jgi:hypothetical protein
MRFSATAWIALTSSSSVHGKGQELYPWRIVDHMPDGIDAL